MGRLPRGRPFRPRSKFHTDPMFYKRLDTGEGKVQCHGNDVLPDQENRHNKQRLAEQELLGDFLAVQQVCGIDGAGNGQPCHNSAGGQDSQNHGGADGSALLCDHGADDGANNRSQAHGQNLAVDDLCNDQCECGNQSHQDPDVHIAEQGGEHTDHPAADTQLSVGGDLAQHGQGADQSDHHPQGALLGQLTYVHDGLAILTDQGENNQRNQPDHGDAQAAPHGIAGSGLGNQIDHEDVNKAEQQGTQADLHVEVELIGNLLELLNGRNVHVAQLGQVDLEEILQCQHVDDVEAHEGDQLNQQVNPLVERIAVGFQDGVEHSHGNSHCALPGKQEGAVAADVDTQQHQGPGGILLVITGDCQNAVHQTEEQEEEGSAGNENGNQECRDQNHRQQDCGTALADLAGEHFLSQDVHSAGLTHEDTQSAAEDQLEGGGRTNPASQQLIGGVVSVDNECHQRHQGAYDDVTSCAGHENQTDQDTQHFHAQGGDTAEGGANVAEEEDQNCTYDCVDVVCGQSFACLG